MSKVVIIMVGVSGSGKSTRAAQIEQAIYENGQICSVVSADHFFMVEDEYVFDIKKIAEAHSWCFNRFIQRVSADDDVVIVDNTNLRPWERQNYEGVARLAGYEVQYEVLKCTTIESIRANAARNKHGLTAELIAQQALSMDLSDIPSIYY
jgi:tRNA uridine 5-carbamoylmethylation protein Kti12